MIRGRSLELAISRAARAYETAGRCVLRKAPTPTITTRDGYVRFAARAGLDFGGTLAGGRAIGIEAKETGRASLPLADWPEHQREDMRRLHQLGAYVRLVVAFQGETKETFAIDWPPLAAFLSNPWRESLSLTWCRAFGQLVPHAGGSCLFLEERPHPLREESKHLVAMEVARPERAKTEKPPLVSFAGLTPEERSQRILNAIAIGTTKAAARGRRRRAP